MMAQQSSFEISGENVITKDSKKGKVKIEHSPKLDSIEYHKEEIEQNKMIIKNAIWMIWIGIVLIIASFVVYVFKLTDSLVAGTICGCFIDLFSGTILYLFNKSNENKRSYFKDLSDTENIEKIIELVNSTNDIKSRDELIKKLIHKYIQK